MFVVNVCPYPFERRDGCSPARGLSYHHAFHYRVDFQEYRQGRLRRKRRECAEVIWANLRQRSERGEFKGQGVSLYYLPDRLLILGLNWIYFVEARIAVPRFGML